MVQLKKRKPPYALTPEEMLLTLSELRMEAVLLHNTLWMSLDPSTADLINNCCTGQQDGGPDTAEEVQEILDHFHVCNYRLPNPFECSHLNSNCNADIKVGHDHHSNKNSNNDSHNNASNDSNITNSSNELPAKDKSNLVNGGFSENMTNGRGRGERRGGGGGGGPHHLIAHSYPCNRRVAVRLTLEESFFLAHVLECLSVFTKDEGSEEKAVEVESGGEMATNEGLGKEGRESEKTNAEIAMKGKKNSSFFPSHSSSSSSLHSIHSPTTITPPAASSNDLSPSSSWPRSLPSIRQLSTVEMWRIFTGIRSNFPTSYAAYHHLKCKGWIPRSGLLYGVDYVIYQLHPAASHSDYGVLVLPKYRLSESKNGNLMISNGISNSHGINNSHDINNSHNYSNKVNDLNSNTGFNNSFTKQKDISKDIMNFSAPKTDLSWLDLQVTNRLINQVCKKMLMLYIHVHLPVSHLINIPSAEMDLEKLSIQLLRQGPDCLRSMTVEERLVQRWVPDAHREDKCN